MTSNNYNKTCLNIRQKKQPYHKLKTECHTNRGRKKFNVTASGIIDKKEQAIVVLLESLENNAKAEEGRVFFVSLSVPLL